MIFLLKETSVFSASQSDGPDVYRKRPDRTLLQDNRKPVLTGSLLSDYLTSDFDIGQSLGKEAALCRIWGLSVLLKGQQLCMRMLAGTWSGTED